MFRGTTVIAVKKESTVIAGDGQVTFGDTVIKSNARKVRRLFNDRIIAGFAGSTADAFTLFEKLEAQLETSGGNLKKACVELAREWRTDRMLRRLEAMLLTADTQNIFLISGSGDVLEPDAPVTAIGSGAGYARAAGLALTGHSNLKAAEIARISLEIAAGICIYTNSQIILEEIQG